MLPTNLSRTARAIPQISLGLRGLASSSKPLSLAYELVEAQSAENSPIVVVHGLFGHKQNWRSLARAMSRRLNTNVYAVDLRNHGTSPHAPSMTHTEMVGDLLHFFETHNLSNVNLIGHSLGGKVSSALALDPKLPEGTLSSLMVVDIAPTKITLGHEFRHYIKAMQEVEAAHVRDTKAAYTILAKNGIPLEIQQFLLTNLAGGSLARRFRIPLTVIEASIGEIGDFPYSPGEAEWKGPTVFVKGEKSPYIKEKGLNTARTFFPNLRLETLPTGHWVHAEKPVEFLDIVVDSIGRTTQ